MWYFSWALGVGLALSFGVLNAMWFEITALPEGQAAAGSAQTSTAAVGSVTTNTEPVGRLG